MAAFWADPAPESLPSAPRPARRTAPLTFPPPHVRPAHDPAPAAAVRPPDLPPTAPRAGSSGPPPGLDASLPNRRGQTRSRRLNAPEPDKTSPPRSSNHPSFMAKPPGRGRRLARFSPDPHQRFAKYSPVGRHTLSPCGPRRRPWHPLSTPALISPEHIKRQGLEASKNKPGAEAPTFCKRGFVFFGVPL